MKSLHALSLVTVACLFGLATPSLSRGADAPPELIDVKVTGTGAKSVVFIPGLGTPGSIWDESVASIQKEATCYVVSLAGFGGKPPVKREKLLPGVEDEIIAYVREHKLDHPVIVGHSLGGVLALDIAAKAPELPGRLLIVDSLPFLAAMISPGISTEADAQQLAAVLQKGISSNPERFADQQKQFVGGMVTSPEKAAAVAEQTGKSDPATTGQAMAELIGHDLRPELSSIRCPVLVLGAMAGQADSGTPPATIEKGYQDQYKNLPQVRFQFFEQSRHFIMVDDPAGFQKVLRSEIGQ